MRVSWSPGYVVPLPERHPFPMGKFAALRAILLAEGVVRPQDVVEPQEAQWADLRLAHGGGYLGALAEGSLERAAEWRMGLPWSKALVRRSRLATQGTLNTALMALEDGMAGTAAIFAGDPDVFTFSIHGAKNFPFTRRRPASTWACRMERATPPISATCSLARGPTSCSIWRGWPVKGDRFGRLSLTPSGLRERDRFVLEAVHRQGAPVVIVLSGDTRQAPRKPPICTPQPSGRRPVSSPERRSAVLGSISRPAFAASPRPRPGCSGAAA